MTHMKVWSAERSLGGRGYDSGGSSIALRRSRSLRLARRIAAATIGAVELGEAGGLAQIAQRHLRSAIAGVLPGVRRLHPEPPLSGANDKTLARHELGDLVGVVEPPPGRSRPCSGHTPRRSPLRRTTARPRRRPCPPPVPVISAVFPSSRPAIARSFLWRLNLAASSANRPAGGSLVLRSSTPFGSRSRSWKQSSTSCAAPTSCVFVVTAEAGFPVVDADDDCSLSDAGRVSARPMARWCSRWTASGLPG